MRFIGRIGLFVAGISLLLMSTAFTFARRNPLPPQLAATVISTHYRQSMPHYDIFLVHAESGLRRRIAFGYGMPDYVEWTADGQWLSFYEGTTYGTGRFLRVDWQGHNQKTIASDGAWFSRQGPPSPDSKWQVWIGLNRTIYLYNPQDGTDALIDTFGEHPQGIRSSQRVAWSADSRWMYVIDIWRYVGDRILGPDTNIIDLDYFIYRIDLENETGDLLTSERAAALLGVEISPQWIVYAHGSLNAESVWRMTADGSDLIPITFPTSPNLNYPLFWATPSGDVIVLQEHISGGVRRYIFKRIMADTRAEEILNIDRISTFQAIQTPIWSPDHRQLTFIAQTIDNDRHLIIVNEDGILQYSAPLELCNETLPFWRNQHIYVLDHHEGSCRLREISPEDDTSTILHQLPDNAQNISIVDDVEPAVLNYSDDLGSTFISLDNRQPTRMDASLNSEIVAWSWLALKTQSYGWATAISLACLAAVIVDTRLRP